MSTTSEFPFQSGCSMCQASQDYSQLMKGGARKVSKKSGKKSAKKSSKKRSMKRGGGDDANNRNVGVTWATATGGQRRNRNQRRQRQQGGAETEGATGMAPNFYDAGSNYPPHSWTMSEPQVYGSYLEKSFPNTNLYARPGATGQQTGGRNQRRQRNQQRQQGGDVTDMSGQISSAIGKFTQGIQAMTNRVGSFTGGAKKKSKKSGKKSVKRSKKTSKGKKMRGGFNNINSLEEHTTRNIKQLKMLLEAPQYISNIDGTIEQIESLIEDIEVFVDRNPEYTNQVSGLLDECKDILQQFRKLTIASGGAKKKSTKRSKKSTKRGSRSRKMRGGGSDWMTTFYSRGAVNTNTPNDKALFTQFADASEYISKYDLLHPDTSLATGDNMKTVRPYDGIATGYEAIGGAKKRRAAKKRTSLKKKKTVKKTVKKMMNKMKKMMKWGGAKKKRSSTKKSKSTKRSKKSTKRSKRSKCGGSVGDLLLPAGVAAGVATLGLLGLKKYSEGRKGKKAGRKGRKAGKKSKRGSKRLRNMNK